MSQTTTKNPFSKLKNIRPTKRISELIELYNQNNTSEFLKKEFDFLRNKEFVNDDGTITIIGKVAYVAGIINISFLSTLMLADFVMQHKRKSTHNKSCHVNPNEIRATLSPFASQNRLKMLTSELITKKYLQKNTEYIKNSHGMFFLNHKAIEKLTSTKFFDDIVNYLKNKQMKKKNQNQNS